MKFTESLSLFPSPTKSNHHFRTSHYPIKYQDSVTFAQIKSIRAYYHLLQSPSDNPKPVPQSKSPIKIHRKSRVSFAFRSYSSSKLAKGDHSHQHSKLSNGMLNYSRSNTKSVERISREIKRSNLSEILQVSPAKK